MFGDHRNGLQTGFGAVYIYWFLEGQCSKSIRLSLGFRVWCLGFRICLKKFEQYFLHTPL